MFLRPSGVVPKRFLLFQKPARVGVRYSERVPGAPLIVSTILKRVAAGEEGAVVECVDEYGGLVWRLARRYLNRADGEIEDAVQEVFVALWIAADRFDPERGSEPAFVATLAHRRLTDYQRRVTSRRRNERAAGRETQFAGSDTDMMQLAEDSGRMIGRLEDLPEEERRAVWMSTYQGMTQSQISEATGAPLGTVKSRLRRGMRRLCEAFSSDAVGAGPGGKR